MALEIRQSLRLSQQLVITPQLQQAIKLLQLNRMELQSLVQHELTENPVLEELAEEESPKDEEEVSVTEPSALLHEANDKEQKVAEIGTKDGELKEPDNFDWENYLGSYNAAEGDGFGGGVNYSGRSDDLPSYENNAPANATLNEHLLWQLHMSNLSEQEVEIAEELIANINEEGYFTGNLEEIAQKLEKDVAFVQEVLESLQEFDPPGVGSRDLKECLSIQIRPFTKDKPLLVKLIENHLNNLELQKYPPILKDLNISTEKLRELAHILSTLEPKPGRPFSGENPTYITPDVFIKKVGEHYLVMLNDDGLPKLQISNFYRNALFKKEMPGQTKEYIQDKLRSAMWLIRSIHQRQRTLYKVTSAIVKFQKPFLDHGVSQLKPMILRDVADEIQMHESTVSRVTTNKYVQTPRGLFELKFFFNTKVPSSTAEGTTSETVKNEIRKLIHAEDVKNPLSDQDIAEMLTQNQIRVARRTVAKYREIMGVLPSSRRRQLL